MKNFLLYTFVAALIASPWPIGGNYPFARTALLATSAILLLGWAVVIWGASLKDARREHESKQGGLRLPIVCWVLLLGVAFTFFQSSSFSEPFGNRVEAVQPTTTAAQEAGGDTIGNSAQQAISVYPPATRKRLVDLLLATGFFIAAAGLLTDRRSITWMLVAISAVGVCLSGFGIVQKLSFDGKIYGVYELLYGGDPFGPFVNGNNAAGFLLTTFAAILFFVASQLLLWGGRQNQSSKRGQEILSSPEWGQEAKKRTSIFASLIKLVSIIEPKHLYFLSLVAVVVAGVCMTLSRGGMLAMLVTTFVVFSLVARTNWKSSLALAVFIMVAGTSLVAFIDRSTEVTKEIESLSDVAAASEMRLLHWNDAISFGMENFLWGVGNGTYRYVSPSFQTFFYPRIFSHAESVYVETFVEMGVIGLTLIILALVSLTFSSIVLINRDSIFDRSLGIAGLGALIGQATISFLDFGLYQAPNSIVMATMMGMIAGRAVQPIESLGRSQTPSPKLGSSPVLQKALQSGLAIALCIGTVWAIYESYGIESERLASRRIAYFDRMNKRSDATKFVKLKPKEIKPLLDTALAIRPDDADVLIQLGELKVAQVRAIVVQETQAALDQQIVKLSEAVTDLQASNADADLLSQNEAVLENLENIQPSSVWATSAPMALHQSLRQAQRRSGDSVEEIFGDKRIGQLLSEAYGDYFSAEQACPWLTLPPLRLGQLAAFHASENGETQAVGFEKEKHYVSVILDRSFTDTQLLYNCGFLALNSGDQAKAVELWAKCLRSPHFNGHERSIVNLCVQEMPMNLFFEQVLPQNPQDLIRIATKYFQPPELLVPKRILLTHTKRRINSTGGLADLDQNLMLAEVAVLEKDYPNAVKFYKAALESEPKSVSWRLKYARALFEIEDFDEALRQLKICQLDSGIRQNQVKSLIAKIRRAR